MNNYDFLCFDCDWEGSGRELQLQTINSQDNEFLYCPNCGSSSIEESDSCDEISAALFLASSQIPDKNIRG